MPINIFGSQQKGVTFVHPELEKVTNAYLLIDNCIKGEYFVKLQGETLLPAPSKSGDQTQDSKRYETYIQRAVFFNATKSITKGLLGQVFSKPPVLPEIEQLQVIIDSPSGNETTLVQQAKQAVEYVILFSRCGVSVDFPKTGGEVTLKDVQDGFVRPTITLYHPSNIRNWKTKNIGAKEVLTLVVLYEDEEIDSPDDPFVILYSPLYRVFKLTPTGVVQEIWEPEHYSASLTVDNKVKSFILRETIPMLDSSGKSLSEIPFKFIGMLKNTSEVENPEMYDLASLNIHHYQNSADYEENCFISGQATPYAIGLTEQWLENVLKNKLTLGARAGIPLPIGAEIGLLQAEASGVLKEALEHKELLMKSLGLKFFETANGPEKTATEAKITSTAEKSLLQSAANNVSEVYLWALQLCATMMNVAFTDDTLQFKLNDDFEISRMDASERTSVVANWQAGALSFNEVRNVMRSTGLATDKDNEVKAEHDKAKDEEANRQAKMKGTVGNEKVN